MEHRRHVLRFRAVNRDIFNAIAKGVKKVETRAATMRYKGIRAGDTLVLVCGSRKIQKRVKTVRIFKSIPALLKKYTPRQIHPGCATAKELTGLYYSFPGYREKIKRSGIIAIEI